MVNVISFLQLLPAEPFGAFSDIFPFPAILAGDRCEPWFCIDPEHQLDDSICGCKIYG